MAAVTKPGSNGSAHLLSVQNVRHWRESNCFTETRSKFQNTICRYSNPFKLYSLHIQFTNQTIQDPSQFPSVSSTNNYLLLHQSILPDPASSPPPALSTRPTSSPELPSCQPEPKCQPRRLPHRRLFHSSRAPSRQHRRHRRRHPHRYPPRKLPQPRRQFQRRVRRFRVPPRAHRRHRTPIAYPISHPHRLSPQRCPSPRACRRR